MFIDCRSSWCMLGFPFFSLTGALVLLENFQNSQLVFLSKFGQLIQCFRKFPKHFFLSFPRGQVFIVKLQCHDRLFDAFAENINFPSRQSQSWNGARFGNKMAIFHDDDDDDGDEATRDVDGGRGDIDRSTW